MYDEELVLDKLKQLSRASRTILLRTEALQSVDGFTGSPAGMEKLDAVCMQLLAVGETLKKIDTMTGGTLFVAYPEIDWKKAKGLRDIISHQYFDINAEAIYDVCKTKIKPLAEAIEKIILGLSA